MSAGRLKGGSLRVGHVIVLTNMGKIWQKWNFCVGKIMFVFEYWEFFSPPVSLYFVYSFHWNSLYNWGFIFLLLKVIWVSLKCKYKYNKDKNQVHQENMKYEVKIHNHYVCNLGLAFPAVAEEDICSCLKSLDKFIIGIWV